MAIHDNVGIVLVKDEGSNYGVDAAPDASNAVYVTAVPKFDLNLESNERTGMNGAASVKDPVIGAHFWDITLEFEVRGSGAAGTAPETDPLWESAGYLGTNTPATSDVYKPSIVSDKSCTIWWHVDGLIYKATGCRGNLSFSIEAGGFMKATWTGKGIYAAPSDGALVSSPVYDATKPVKLVGATFTYDSYAAILRSLSLDGGVGSTALKSNAATGISSVELDRFNVTGSMTIGHVLVATRAVEALAIAGAAVAFSLALGSTAGNICTITSSSLIKTGVAKSSNGGQLDLSIDFKLSESTSLNDDITWSFT